MTAVETIGGMRLGAVPRCFLCKTNESLHWRRDVSRGVLLCINCQQNQSTTDPPSASSSKDVGAALNKITRRPKLRPGSANSLVKLKGKSRHSLNKKTPYKAPAPVSTITTSDYVFHKGVYYQVGDIVSLVDEEDGRAYYAQVRGFLQDQYCEKSAVITWLIPTTNSPEEGFCAETFVLGVEEDVPRRLDFMQFVCHAPSDYFKAQKAPYVTSPAQPELACIWTTVGPQISVKPTREQLYGVHTDDVGSDVETKDSDKISKAKKKKKDKEVKDVSKDTIKEKKSEKTKMKPKS